MQTRNQMHRVESDKYHSQAVQTVTKHNERPFFLWINVGDGSYE